MDNGFLCGAITHKLDGRKEIFPLKVDPIIKRAIKNDLGTRSRLAQAFGIKACEQLGINPKNCQISILKPKEKNYKIFLDSLKKFSQQDLEGMTIDLSDFQNKSDA